MMILKRTLWNVRTAIASVVALMAILAGISLSESGSAALHKIGIGHTKNTLASAGDGMCVASSNDLNNEVFFVSCGSFF